MLTPVCEGGREPLIDEPIKPAKLPCSTGFCDYSLQLGHCYKVLHLTKNLST